MARLCEMPTLEGEIERLRQQLTECERERGEINEALGILDNCMIVPLVASLREQIATQSEAIDLQLHTNHRIAALEAENARLKTVLMKYQRMEFNAQLQSEIDASEKGRIPHQYHPLRHHNGGTCAACTDNALDAAEGVGPVAECIDDGTPEGGLKWIPYNATSAPIEVGTKLYTHPVPAVSEGWQLVPKEPTDAMKRNYVKEFGYPSYGVGHEYKFMLSAAPTPSTNTEIKPHQITKLVNELRDIAVKYHDHQSLRERLAGPVHDLWNCAASKTLTTPKPEDVK